MVRNNTCYNVYIEVKNIECELKQVVCNSHNSVCHPVWAESPHRAELLQGVLVLPLLRKLLLLGTLTVHKLLPPLGRTLITDDHTIT